VIFLSTIKKRGVTICAAETLHYNLQDDEGTMAVWSVNIIAGANPGDPATFVAQNQPTAPAGTIYADPGDVVSWNNATAQDHQPVQLDLIPPLGTLVWPVVTPGHQTSAYVVSGKPGTTISYTCQLHPSESGKIVITPVTPTA
jgi:plastocyanin